MFKLLKDIDLIVKKYFQRVSLMKFGLSLCILLQQLTKTVTMCAYI